MLIDALNNDDLAGVFGNPGKIGSGVISLGYNSIFLLQKFVLYPEGKKEGGSNSSSSSSDGCGGGSGGGGSSKCYGGSGGISFSGYQPIWGLLRRFVSPFSSKKTSNKNFLILCGHQESYIFVLHVHYGDSNKFRKAKVTTNFQLLCNYPSVIFMSDLKFRIIPFFVLICIDSTVT